MSGDLFTRARRASGLSQDELARRSGTSRPTLSAYENGHKSPSLSTTARILDAAGLTLDIAPKITFTDIVTSRNRVITVPDRLWRLPFDQAFADVQLPLHLDWSTPGRGYPLRIRSRRARVYEIVLREGLAKDLLAYIDGALLVDLWADLVVSLEIRNAWQIVIDRGLATTEPEHMAS